MTETKRCPECGNPLPDKTPLGGCPTCMLALGMQTPTGALARTSAAGSRWSAPSVEELNEVFPQLTIAGLLGQGGMGAVYQAKQDLLDRDVALKILPKEVSQDPAFEERFVREARALAQLSHPHIVVVYEFGQQDGMFFLIMEYVEGITLREAIADGTLSPREGLAIVTQICGALEYAHDHGVVHRDIKPENILLDIEGNVKIADFGLAKLVDEGPHWNLTGTHQVMGTPHYMAPEQVERPLDVDHRADIFSLGVVFYELLTGQLPLGRFKVPSELSDSDVRWDKVVLKSLERDPADRFQTVNAVRQAIEDEGRAAVPPPLPNQVSPPANLGSERIPDAGPSPAPSPQRINPGPVLAGGISLLFGLCLLVYGLRSSVMLMWCGLGLLLGAAYSVSAAFDKSKQEDFLETPNLGTMIHAVIMIWLGIAFLLGSPMGFGGLWIGMGMILGGSGMFGKAWDKPQDGVMLREWNAPDGSTLMHGGILLAIGVGLFLWGWWIQPNMMWLWIGFGLTMGGGGHLANAWKMESK